MRNAKISDCHGGWRFNVMYNVKHAWYGFVLAHIKEKVVVCGVSMFAMETADGCPILAEYEWLKPIARKQGTPAKSKKSHQRGTKPWLSKFEYVDYDPKLIAPGVRVKCRDKKIRTIEFVCHDHIQFVECDNLVDTKSGLGNYIRKIPFYCDIMKILVEKKTDKHIHDRYNGYTVGEWHFWKGNTNVPPVGGDVKVQVWLRHYNKEEQTAAVCAKYYKWKSGHEQDDAGDDIIAFKIVSDQ